MPSAVACCPSPAAVSPECDLEGRNRAVVRRMFAAADAGDLAAVRACLSPGFVDHTPSATRRGSDGIAADRDHLLDLFARLGRAFPDTRHTIEDFVAEGDRVAIRVSATGTHRGEIFGLAPTGRSIAMRSIVLYRLAEGRIVERWSDCTSSVRELLDAPLDAPPDVPPDRPAPPRSALGVRWPPGWRA